MSWSGYGDNDCYEYYELYRSAVWRAITGARGQAFLRELIAALDAMPEKRLIADALIRDGEVCAIGSVGLARGMDMTRIDYENPRFVGRAFGIARSMAAEIEFENDGEHWYEHETDEARWRRMRAWAVSNLNETPE